MKNTETKKDVYEIITERILALLEQGEIPWQKPWRTSSADLPPSNYVTKKPYRGINAFMLLCAPYSCPLWLTYKQATEVGGNVKKGEKAWPVVFWNWFPKRDKNGKPIIGANGKPEQVPFLRYYSVFNVEQCEGIKWEKPVAPEGQTFDPIAEAQRIAESMPDAPTVRHGGKRACYAPAVDVVEMPDRESFVAAPEYYSTLFHELTHSTGHAKRLARKGITELDSFGSDQYAREELIAEMGAAFLCGHAGVLHKTVENSAAYIQNWIRKIREDSKLVVTAAAQAQKAADYVLGIKHDTVAE